MSHNWNQQKNFTVSCTILFKLKKLLLNLYGTNIWSRLFFITPYGMRTCQCIINLHNVCGCVRSSTNIQIIRFTPVHSSRHLIYRNANNIQSKMRKDFLLSSGDDMKKMKPKCSSDRVASFFFEHWNLLVMQIFLSYWPQSVEYEKIDKVEIHK